MIENFFKDNNTTGFEDFMADREQDTPRDIDLQLTVCSVCDFNSVSIGFHRVWIKIRLERKW